MIDNREDVKRPSPKTTQVCAICGITGEADLSSTFINDREGGLICQKCEPIYEHLQSEGDL